MCGPARRPCRPRRARARRPGRSRSASAGRRRPTGRSAPSRGCAGTARWTRGRGVARVGAHHPGTVALSSVGNGTGHFRSRVTCWSADRTGARTSRRPLNWSHRAPRAPESSGCARCPTLSPDPVLFGGLLLMAVVMSGAALALGPPATTPAARLADPADPTGDGLLTRTRRLRGGTARRGAAGRLGRAGSARPSASGADRRGAYRSSSSPRTSARAGRAQPRCPRVARVRVPPRRVPRSGTPTRGGSARRRSRRRRSRPAPRPRPRNRHDPVRLRRPAPSTRRPARSPSTGRTGSAATTTSMPIRPTRQPLGDQAQPARSAPRACGHARPTAGPRPRGTSSSSRS